MINYFKIINKFWDEAPYLAAYKADHAALFFAILDSINRNTWRETDIEYDRLINKVRLGKKNYLDCRQWLVSNGFITLKPGRGDYAKARFGLGNAVLTRTAQISSPDNVNRSVAVLDAVLGGTASSTLQNESAVLPNTASGAATGTASDTYLLEVPITSNLLPNIQQPDSLFRESDGSGNGKSETDSLKEKKGEEPAHPPTPLPTIQEVCTALLGSIPHQRYAIEQIKVASSQLDYTQLVDIYVTQQEALADGEHPPFKSVRDARRHFMNWLGKRTEFNSIPTIPNGNTNKRGTGTLRPTAIGKPHYRGEGSNCDVDL